MDYRVTLGFKSDSDRQYLYDDVTGCILPWSDVREDTLKAVIAGRYAEAHPGLVSTYGEEAVENATRLIRHWRERYGAFVRTWDESRWQESPPVDQLSDVLGRYHLFQLILVLTEDCNMCCKYCAYSEAYPLNRKRTARRMTFDTACRAVDLFMEMVQPQLRRNPRKRFGLTFYGGEPLINLPVLKATLKYARDAYPGLFVPVMTTNGTLLRPRTVPMLVEHQVFVAVSLDGPEEEHDRLRVFPNNRGTHRTILRNLRWIRQHYPDYWQRYMTTVSVYDWGTNVEAAEHFFRDNEDVVPRSVFVNKVGQMNTDYYDQYTPEDQRLFMERVNHLVDEYKTAMIDGRPVSTYMRSLVGFPIAMCQLRQRLLDQKASFLPYSGTCIPGTKICVHTDGRLDMCERVNGTYPIGHLEQGGVNFERLREIIDRYRKQVLYECPSCPASRQCNICYSMVETNGDFARIPSLCAETVQNTRRRLVDYVSMQEQNPQADFHFETDISYLEQRFLFFF